MEINNSILGAMQVVSEATIKNLGVDKTIICKILSFNKTDNSYVVSNDSIKFIAYPNNDDQYIVGSQVNVFIPKGDFSSKQKKLITGKYSDGDSDIVYTNSYDDLIMVYNLSLDDPYVKIEPATATSRILSTKKQGNNKYTFSLNSFENFESFLKETSDFSQFVDYTTWDMGLKPYTILGLSFKPSVNLFEKKDYLITLSIKNKKRKTEQYIFHSSEMSGNPLYHDGHFIQTKYFSIPDNLDFTKDITITLGYENSLKEEEFIELSDINIFVGYRQNDFEKDEYSFIKREYDFCPWGYTEPFHIYQGQVYLILYDNNSQKYKFIKNLSDLPEDYSLQWSLGYLCPGLTNLREDFSNNYWYWKTKKQQKVNDNIPISIITFKDNSTKSLTIPNWAIDFPQKEKVSGNENITIDAISILCKIFKNNQEIIKSDYFYWSNNNSNSPVFLSIEDSQYYNGYYLYAPYKQYNESETRTWGQLVNTNNSSILRSVKLNLMNIDKNKISKIEWCTDHRDSEQLIPDNPIITNWSNSKIGRFSIINTEPGPNQNLDDWNNWWEKNFGNVGFESDYLDVLSITKPKDNQLDINFYLAEKASFDPSTSTMFITFLCRIFMNSNQKETPDYITYLTIPISSISNSDISASSQVEGNNDFEVNRKGLLKEKGKNVEYVFTDKISQSQVDENQLFVTTDLEVSWAQSSLINNGEEWLNGMFYTISNADDKKFSAVINLHEQLQNSNNITEHYNVLKSTFKGRSLDYPEALVFNEYLPIGLNLTGNESIYLSIIIKNKNEIIDSDFWNTSFKEEDLKNLTNLKYYPILKQIDPEKAIDFDIVAEGTVLGQSDINYFFKKNNDNSFSINFNNISYKEEKICLVIREKNASNILWIQPLYIIPKE